MAGKAKGKEGLYVELLTDEVAAFREFCRARGTKLTEEIRLAIRRHIANPPEVSPLPPFPPPEAKAKPAGKKGKSK